jgi:ATP-dependent exoDNAse (exonuclease V) alpha subunit
MTVWLLALLASPAGAQPALPPTHPMRPGPMVAGPNQNAGHAATISPGERITATRKWVNDRTHGQQFKAQFLRATASSSAEGIERYLGSGMIRGIGPVYAKKMVKAFDEKVFDNIEAEPNRLRKVHGIGPLRARRITAAWAEQKIVREIMIFLHTRALARPGLSGLRLMGPTPFRS